MKKFDLKKKITGLIGYAENYRISAWSFIAVFLCISFIRNFLEGAAESSRAIGTSRSLETAIMQMGVLFNLEWIALLSAISLAIASIARRPVLSVLKITLLFYIWIIIVPVFDFIAYFPAGCKIDYIYTVQGYLKALACFFMPWVNVDVCSGIRFEVFAAFIISASYVHMKTGSLIKSAAAALAVYFLAVSSMSYPVFILAPALLFHSQAPDEFVKLFFYGKSLGGDFLSRNSIMIFALLLPVLTAIYRSHYGKKGFSAAMANLLSPLSLWLGAVFFAGFMSAPVQPGQSVFSSPFDAVYLCAGTILFILSGFFIVSTSSKNENPAMPGAVMLVVAVSFAYSFQVFMIMLFIICLCAILYRAPFSLAGFGFFRAAAVPAFVFTAFTAGHASVAGAGALSSMNFWYALALSIVPLFITRLETTNKPYTLLSSLLVLSYMAIPVFAPSPLVFPLSFISAALSMAVIYVQVFKRFGKYQYLIYVIYLLGVGFLERISS